MSTLESIAGPPIFNFNWHDRLRSEVTAALARGESDTVERLTRLVTTPATDDQLWVIRGALRCHLLANKLGDSAFTSWVKEVEEIVIEWQKLPGAARATLIALKNKDSYLDKSDLCGEGILLAAEAKRKHVVLAVTLVSGEHVEARVLKSDWISPKNPTRSFWLRALDGRNLWIGSHAIQLDDIAQRSRVAVSTPFDPSLDLASSLAERHGIQFMHGTRLKDLASIVRSKKLVPIGKQGRRAVYLEAFGPAQRDREIVTSKNDRSVVLVFGNQVLNNRSDYTFRPDWMFGRPGSGNCDENAGRAHDLRKMHNLFDEIAAGFVEQNEFVFDGGVGLASLRAIWTRPGETNAVLAVLRDESFTPPNGQRLEDLVKERSHF